MADPFVAEIRVVGFNFPPKGWATCNGGLLPISQYTALFSLLGTTYGGDGKSIFALPDIQGNCVMGFGQGPGLSYRDEGEVGGSQTVQLDVNEMPAHLHMVNTVPQPATTSAPSSDVAIARSGGGSAYKQAPVGALTPMAPLATSANGNSQPHNNMMPYLTMNFVIALQGVFPPRS